MKDPESNSRRQAVALAYQEGDAPRILARGYGDLAETILLVLYAYVGFEALVVLGGDRHVGHEMIGVTVAGPLCHLVLQFQEQPVRAAAGGAVQLHPHGEERLERT